MLILFKGIVIPGLVAVGIDFCSGFQRPPTDLVIFGQIFPVLTAAIRECVADGHFASVLVIGSFCFVCFSVDIADLQRGIAIAVIGVFCGELAGDVILAAADHIAVAVKGLFCRQQRKTLCHGISAALGRNAAAAILIFVGIIAVGQQAELIGDFCRLIAVFVIGIMRVGDDSAVFQAGSYCPHQDGLRRFAEQRKAASAASATFAAGAQTDGQRKGQHKSEYPFPCMFHISLLLIVRQMQTAAGESVKTWLHFSAKGIIIYRIYFCKQFFLDKSTI